MFYEEVAALSPDAAMGVIMALGDRKSPVYLPLRLKSTLEQLGVSLMLHGFTWSVDPIAPRGNAPEETAERHWWKFW